MLGALLDVLAILLRVYDLNDIKRIMNRLNNQIESKNMNKMTEEELEKKAKKYELETWGMGNEK